MYLYHCLPEKVAKLQGSTDVFKNANSKRCTEDDIFPVLDTGARLGTRMKYLVTAPW